jgi:hypothetical protein
LTALTRMRSGISCRNRICASRTDGFETPLMLSLSSIRFTRNRHAAPGASPAIYRR